LLQRRGAARAGGRRAALNGIDFLEVLDDPSVPTSDAAAPLRSFREPVQAALTPANLSVEGGERIRGIHAVAVMPTEDARVLTSTWIARRFLRLHAASRVGNGREGSQEPPRASIGSCRCRVLVKWDV